MLPQNTEFCLLLDFRPGQEEVHFLGHVLAQSLDLRAVEGHDVLVLSDDLLDDVVRAGRLQVAHVGQHLGEELLFEMEQLWVELEFLDQLW